MVISAAAVQLLPTIRTHIEATGMGVRFAAPFGRDEVLRMVQLLAPAATVAAAAAETPPLEEPLAAARSLLRVAVGVMDFMLVEPTPALTHEIAAAAATLLRSAAELAAEHTELLTKLLGNTAFATGVLAELSRDNGVTMRALLLDASVRAAASCGGDANSLSLKGYRLDDADKAALLVALPTLLRQLTGSLDLNNHRLGRQFGLVIAVALQSEHCKLTSLDLGFNRLGVEAGLAIAMALQSEHCKLTTLNLASNELGAEAVLAIAVALQSE
eukprot:SAG31_NODE_8856_length_1374_cov_1.128627_2_plen_271_part_01